MRRGSRGEDARRGSRLTDLARDTAVILAAAGLGERVGGRVPKQFLEISGRPLIRWAFEAVVAAGFEQIVVVVPKQRISETEDLLPEGGHVTGGGATRQASVRNGLSLIETDLVLVHDAARPFTPPTLFGAVLEALGDADAVVPGLQMKETVKVVRDGRVVQTLQREEVWNIQTPQGFKTSVLRDAHRRAEADGVAGTDDAQLVEHYGTEVRVVPGAPLAFKITDADDVRRAESMARQTQP